MISTVSAFMLHYIVLLGERVAQHKTNADVFTISPLHVDSIPSIGELTHFGIINKVSTKWRDLGRLLELTTSELDGYEKQAMLDNETCCERVIDHWINNGGNSHYPLSYNGIHHALCIARLTPSIA